jgi:hypothetical protein
VKLLRRKFFWIFIVVVVLGWFLLSFRTTPAFVTYGVSFSRFHVDELKLDWREVFGAIINDLGVRHFRFSAHWPLTEPGDGQYNFKELDYQIGQVEKAGGSFILAVGRRLPGWPECHVPDWAKILTEEKQREKIMQLLDKVVNRYKGSKALKYWQVENEPFLGFFGRASCQEPNEAFLRQEIELVRKIDPDHPVLVTDSGEFGTWYKAYRNGDVFGSSMYLYVWSRFFGPIRYPIGPSFFRVKQNLIDIFWGKKEKLLVELSAEPWLLHPIVETDLETQFKRMNINKIEESIKFAQKTGFGEQYLWGAEWWYWLKKQGHPEFWDYAKPLFER